MGQGASRLRRFAPALRVTPRLAEVALHLRRKAELSGWHTRKRPPQYA